MTDKPVFLKATLVLITLNHAASGFSLALTFPGLLLAGMVVWYWGKPALLGLKKLLSVRWWKDEADHSHFASLWFALGVAWGFGFEIFDSGYWFIPWSLSFIDSQYTDFWMTNGVLFNIPFRQVRIIASAYCHLRSAICHGFTGDLTTKKLHYWIMYSTLLGILYSMLLLWTKT